MQGGVATVECGKNSRRTTQLCSWGLDANLSPPRGKRRNADAAAFGHGMHLRHGGPCRHCAHRDHECEACPTGTPPARPSTSLCTTHLRHPHLLRPARPCTGRRTALCGNSRCHRPAPTLADRRYRKRRHLPVPLRIRHRLPPRIHIHPRRIPIVPHTVLVHPVPPDPIRRQEITPHLVVCRRTVQRVGTCPHAVGCRRYHGLPLSGLSIYETDSPPSWMRFGRLRGAIQPRPVYSPHCRIARLGLLPGCLVLLNRPWIYHQFFLFFPFPFFQQLTFH